MLKKEFGNGLSLTEDASVIVNDMDEMLALGGVQIKLGPGATFDFQAGTMNNAVNYTVTGADEAGNAVKNKAKLEMDKLLLMGSVTVLF